MNWILLGVAAVIGILAGVASTHLFLIGWWNLILWAALGIAIGYFARDTHEAMWSGALYGVVLTVSFLLSGFGGSPDVFLAFLVLTLGLCVPGVIGGILSVWAGHAIAARLLPSRMPR